MSFEAIEIVYDKAYAPTVTLTRDTAGTLTATLEIEGLDPQRDPSVEEQGLGILSLDPPRVYAADKPTRRRTIDALISAAYRAVFASVAATTGATPAPYELSTIGFRISTGLRAALRLVGEDA
jgi:hypothetical protein